jgi:hypothetical protein
MYVLAASNHATTAWFVPVALLPCIHTDTA